MSKVQGPMLSLKAGGTFGKTITFQGRRGSTAAFLRKVPYDTRTDVQSNIRGYVASGVSYWQSLPTEYISKWNDFVS